MLLIYIVLCLVNCKYKNGNYIENDESIIRTFHGINALQIQNLTENQCKNLIKNGLNLIRLGISFQQAVPKLPKNNMEFNQTYLNNLKTMIQTANQYNISIILVADQYLLNQQLCGYGFPDWAINVSTFPKPQQNHLDKQLKYPSSQECQNIDSKEKTWDVGRNFMNLYTNKNNLTDYFGLFWQGIIKNIINETNIIGYELLNNPLAGDYNSGMFSYLWPGYSNRYILTPFYQKISNYIREIDKDKIILFQASNTDTTVSGFDDCIEGDLFRDRESYSFQLNCGYSLTRMCAMINYYYGWLNYKIGTHFKIGSIISDFQGIESDILNGITNQADQLLLSWVYSGWDMNEQNTLPQELIRPFAQSICTNELYYNHYEQQFGIYKLQYFPKPQCQTLIFIPFNYNYQCNHCIIKRGNEFNHYEVKPNSYQDEIILIVFKK